MTAEQWKILGISLCVLGAAVLVLSQILLHWYQKKMERDQFSAQ